MIQCPKCCDTGILKHGQPISLRCDCPAGEKFIPQDARDNCKLCHDTGWIPKTIDGLSFSTRCNCVADKKAGKRIEAADIPPKYASCSFEQFVIPHGLDSKIAEQMRFVNMWIQRFAEEFPTLRDPRGLLIFGGNGTGKTHLAVAVFRNILAKGHEGRFINYQALLRLIKAGYDKPFGGSRTAEYDTLEEVEVLLLDDLGANRVTDWVEDTITDLISQRYDHQRPIIVTTNCSPFGESATVRYLGDQIGERATSRLREMCKVFAMPAIGDHRGSHR